MIGSGSQIPPDVLLSGIPADSFQSSDLSEASASVNPFA